MPTYTLTIAGSPKSIRAGSLRITETINGRNTMSFDVLSLDGSYRPAPYAEVIYTRDSTRLFGGYVENPGERGFSPTGGTAIVTGVECVDFNSLADRRYVTETIDVGSTLKAALQVLDDYLTPYGVTLDAAQATGPTLPQLIFDARKLRDCFDELSTLTGYVWEIDYNKTLRMVLPGSNSAPFNVDTSSDPTVVRGDITVESFNQEYANRVILRSGPRAPEDHVAGWHSDGVTATFEMYFHVLQHYGFVFIEGVGPETLGASGSGAQWIFDEGPPQTITRVAGALSLGTQISFRNLSEFPVVVQADDAGEQALRGLWETLIEVPNMYGTDAAQALADAYLARAVTTFKRVQYSTDEDDIHPGQTQTITVPIRNLSGTFMVTDVETTDTVAHTFVHRVTAVGGSTIPGSWRELYREWSGSPSSTAVAAVIAPSSAALLSAPVYLGGSHNTSVAKSPAAWTPVPGHMPYTALSSFGGRVRAHIFARNAGVTATARLYDVTAAASVASSSGVTSQTETEVTFLVTITAGHVYRLEILSSASGEGVFGRGSLEAA